MVRLALGQRSLIGKRRVLLIGDSIAYGYHRFVADNLAGKYNTDLLSTSKSLDDQGLLRELDYMFSEHIYSGAFQQRLHGMHQSVGWLMPVT